MKTARQARPIAAPLAAATLLLGAGFARADTVVPGASVATPGTGGSNTLTREAANARSYQWVIGAPELSTLTPGSQITGVSIRLQSAAANATNWPSATITWPSYTVVASTSPNPPSTATLNFADNTGARWCGRRRLSSISSGTAGWHGR